ncbi:DUF1254 domain-containing protein [Nocardia sp. 004]|uniref:DUF1254 domain-containing protein n=1 Tax=Nocardia sp. 004 TaxID=3385978 RepID=UPI0039A1995F
MDDRTDGRVTVSRRTALGIAATSVVAFGLTACGGSDRTDSGTGVSPDEAVAIAREAYIFGYPLVLMDVTRVMAEATTPINQFRHPASLPTPMQREVVRPSLDILNSTAWLDLRNEPMVLQVPPMDRQRWWLVQLLDAWSNTVHSPGSIRPRAVSAAPPYGYVVTGPGWSGTLPENLTPLAMPTPTVWLIVRIQVDGVADLPAVRAVQQQLTLVPLSVWLAGTGSFTPVTPPAVPPIASPPAAQIEAMAPRVFFDRMCAVMANEPSAPADEPTLSRFATIGIEPGGRVGVLSDAVLAKAVSTAQRQIPVYIDETTIKENGWVYMPSIGHYGTNYLLRAVIAWNGLGAARSEDAIYPTLFAATDAAGSTGRFGLHFAPGMLPPVDAFWSLTLYGPDLYLLPNQAKIYAVGHPAPVVLNSDGSLDIILQYADPGASVPRGNWLPIPETGQFSLTLRMYAPRAEAVQGIWQPPPLLPLR